MARDRDALRIGQRAGRPRRLLVAVTLEGTPLETASTQAIAAHVARDGQRPAAKRAARRLEARELAHDALERLLRCVARIRGPGDVVAERGDVSRMCMQQPREGRAIAGLGARCELLRRRIGRRNAAGGDVSVKRSRRLDPRGSAVRWALCHQREHGALTRLRYRTACGRVPRALLGCSAARSCGGAFGAPRRDRLHPPP